MSKENKSIQSYDSSVIHENKFNGDPNEYDQNKEDMTSSQLKERIHKYLKLDNLIKEKEKEHKAKMRDIKKRRIEIENQIINYLDKLGEDIINVGNTDRLTKCIKESKTTIKPTLISDVLMSEFKKRQLYEDDNELNDVVKEFIQNIDTQREIRYKKVLVRSDPEKEAKKLQNKKKVGAKKAVHKKK